MVIGNEILIYDHIGHSYDGSGYDAVDFAEDLARVGNRSRIDVHINSGGGSVSAGLGILDRILDARRAGKAIYTYADGAAFSIASVILMGGTRVIAGSSAILMLHQPHVGHTSGDAKELKRTVKALEVVSQQLVEIYMRQTGKSKKVVTDWLEAESWFTASEALAVGLVDEVSDEPAALAPLAASYSGYRVPERVLAAARRPVTERLRQVVRQAMLATESNDYETSRLYAELAADYAERLTRTPGATTHDLAICACALKRIDLHANTELDW